jgi:hypothetical protein
MTCCFCGRHEELEDGIEEGWIPSFWAKDKEWEGPVCGPCTTHHLSFNEDYGDCELRPGHDLPELAIPLAKHPNLGRGETRDDS